MASEPKDRSAARGDQSGSESKGRQAGGPLTVMIITSLGLVLSFKIFPGILLSATIFFLAYIIISIIIINKYGDLRSANAELDRVLTREQREVEQKRGSLRDFRQRIANLEKQIDRIETDRERQARTYEEQESPPEMTKD